MAGGARVDSFSLAFPCDRILIGFTCRSWRCGAGIPDLSATRFRVNKEYFTTTGRTIGVAPDLIVSAHIASGDRIFACAQSSKSSAPIDRAGSRRSVCSAPDLLTAVILAAMPNSTVPAMASTHGPSIATHADAHGGATRSTRGRIPSLDGLRAISILLVVASHLGGTVGFPLSHYVTAGVVNVGALGVSVFFVISGFLITGLLLSEQEQTGGIALGRFYYRRTMRIMPPYFAFVAFVAIAPWANWVQLRPGDLWHALTYTMNYHPDRGWPLGHTWSLAVEEQFYLLWPMGLLLLGRRRAAWFAITVIALAPLVRVFEVMLLPSDSILRLSQGQSFETVADALAVGCVLALLRVELWGQLWYRRLLASRWCMLLPVVVFVTPVMRMAMLPRAVRGIYALAGVTIVNVSIALLIDWSVRNARGRIGRFLNSRLLVKIGVMSYSLYLWQEVFLNRHARVLVTSFPVNVLLAGLAAAASYYLVEAPALQLRARLERRRPATVPYRNNPAHSSGPTD